MSPQGHRGRLAARPSDPPSSTAGEGRIRTPEVFLSRGIPTLLSMSPRVRCVAIHISPRGVLSLRCMCPATRPTSPTRTPQKTQKIYHSCAGRGGVLRVASPMRERGRGASFRVESSQTRGQFRRARSPARTFETENDQRVRVEVSRGVESV